MIILVADTSVIIDLERGGLLALALASADRFATPDVLYDNELASNVGPELLRLGLQIVNLDGNEMATVQTLYSSGPLALADYAALVAARRPDHELLTGDRLLRQHADRHRVPCHGLLWLLDRIALRSVHTINALHAGLTTIAAHPRCRLPPREVQERLRHWKRA